MDMIKLVIPDLRNDQCGVGRKESVSQAVLRGRIGHGECRHHYFPFNFASKIVAIICQNVFVEPQYQSV